MTIRKQEFYEGAALHILARSGRIKTLRYEVPFFIMNDGLVVLLKYSTRGRSPWGFTFMPDEQTLLRSKNAEQGVIIGLICGADGVAAFSYESYRSIAPFTRIAVHVACYRRHGEHYEVNGPHGTLNYKVAPSNWRRILEP
jgi:hypothetical protein